MIQDVFKGGSWQNRVAPQDNRAPTPLLYAQAEEKARADGLGLWQDKNPMPPWEHRRLYR